MGKFAPIFSFLFLILLRLSRRGRAKGDSSAATELYCPLRSTATSAVGLILVARKTDPRRDQSPSSSLPLDSKREFRTQLGHDGEDDGEDEYLYLSTP